MGAKTSQEEAQLQTANGICTEEAESKKKQISEHVYRVFHVKEPIKKRYISACRKGGVILKTVSKRSFGPILLCKISYVSLK